MIVNLKRSLALSALAVPVRVQPVAGSVYILTGGRADYRDMLMTVRDRVAALTADGIFE